MSEYDPMTALDGEGRSTYNKGFESTGDSKLDIFGVGVTPNPVITKPGADGPTTYTDNYPADSAMSPNKSGSASDVPDPDILNRGYTDTNGGIPGSVRKVDDVAKAYRKRSG